MNHLPWPLLTAVTALVLAVVVLGLVTGRVRSTSTPVTVLALGTLALLLVGCAFGLQLDRFDELNCPVSEGASTYGRFAWSTVPPGPTCTFTVDEHGFGEVQGPSPVMSVWLGLVAVGAVASAVLLVRERRRHPRIPRPRPGPGGPVPT